jgi:glycosyltransferase involved in cell wall biosynthesis
VGVPPINGNAGRFRTRFALPGKMALFVGRLERHKGYQELVKAVSRLPEKSMHLILMGPHSSESLAFAETVGASNVRFLGHVPEQEKQDAISACDILCLPSDSEVMPVVVLEAWLSGKPVLTGDIPAIRSFVTDGETGVLVRRDAAAIERALRSFLREPSSWQAMGLKGKRVVETRYRIDQVAFALRDIYDHAHKTRKEDTRGVPS